MKEYDHKKIEKKWQGIWAKKRLHEAKGKGKKFYPLIEFPYPSGDGLHVGHIRGYTAMDIIARKRRAEGFDVLYPIGWDAFGLPTENYAVKTGVHPKIVTKKNTDIFRRQLQSLGFSFDWSREINTTDPEYYRWTQWIFLKFFEQGLAYKAKATINWCPSCKIGLANEEAVGGVCERCGGTTEKREKEQWMLEITKYAGRLVKDLDKTQFLEKIKTQQKNWIGESQGAEISFPLFDESTKKELANLVVFTTRPDTLYGVTYLVVAPEHSLLSELRGTIKNFPEVGAYSILSSRKSDIERGALGREKTGVPLKGITARNPATGDYIPLWVADYVLPHYGTGAIMAVPAHDERDYEFAQTFRLPLQTVIEPITGEKRTGEKFRKSIVALISDPKQKKILVLDWGMLGGKLLIGGGIEDGESPEEAARREIAEETGYTALKLHAVSEKVHHHYFAHAKGEAREIEATGLFFELLDDHQAHLSHDPSEQGKFSSAWVNAAVAEQEIQDPLHAYIFQKFIRGKPYTGHGILVNSGRFDGKSSKEGGEEIIRFVGGKKKITFKLRDWVFSRQRYWGEPIPLVFCELCKIRGESLKRKGRRGKLSKGEKRNPGWFAIPEKFLPLKLPEVKKYHPTDNGESPLASLPKWVNAKCPVCGGRARRETDTMPNWAGSSWYYLRYTDPKNKKAFASQKALKYFTPVDWYNGGMEHTTLHLLYSRFWHKFLYDLKLVPTTEPYRKRTSHGIITAKDGSKISKSKGNVITPDDVVKRLGADTLRLYEMFMGPFDQAIQWNMESVAGVHRFLERVSKMKKRVKVRMPSSDLMTLTHHTIKKVSEDIEDMKFNTAVSALMIFGNALEESASTEGGIPRSSFMLFLRLLAPFAPHLPDELHSVLGGKGSIHEMPWPLWDAKKLLSDTVTLPIQINGKVRDSIRVSRTLSRETLQKQVLELPEVKKRLVGMSVIRVVFVPGRVVNLVVSPH